MEEERGKIWFCKHCGDYLLLVDHENPLEQCPLRPEDNSIVFDEERKQISTTLKAGETVIVKRLIDQRTRLEKQLRLNCSTCNTPIAFHQEGKFLYINGTCLKE